MIDNDKIAFKEMLVAMFSLYDEPAPDKEVLRSWWAKLEKYEFSAVSNAFDRWADVHADNRLPKASEISDMCKPREQDYKAMPITETVSEHKEVPVEITQLAKKVFSNSIDGKSWARHIMNHPEDYPDVSLLRAKQALGLIGD